MERIKEIRYITQAARSRAGWTVDVLNKTRSLTKSLYRSGIKRCGQLNRLLRRQDLVQAFGILTEYIIA